MNLIRKTNVVFKLFNSATSCKCIKFKSYLNSLWNIKTNSFKKVFFLISIIFTASRNLWHYDKTANCIPNYSSQFTTTQKCNTSKYWPKTSYSFGTNTFYSILSPSSCVRPSIYRHVLLKRTVTVERINHWRSNHFLLWWAIFCWGSYFIILIAKGGFRLLVHIQIRNFV